MAAATAFIAPIASFFSTAAPIISVIGAAASVASAVGAVGGKTPKAPTPIAPVDPAANQQESEVAQRTAADKQRRQAQAAVARQATILTSSEGITAKPRTILGG